VDENMREAKIYIKNIEKHKNHSELGAGGGYRLSTGNIFTPLGGVEISVREVVSNCIRDILNILI